VALRYGKWNRFQPVSQRSKRHRLTPSRPILILRVSASNAGWTLERYARKPGIFNLRSSMAQFDGGRLESEQSPKPTKKRWWRRAREQLNQDFHATPFLERRVGTRMGCDLCGNAFDCKAGYMMSRGTKSVFHPGLHRSGRAMQLVDNRETITSAGFDNADCQSCC